MTESLTRNLSSVGSSIATAVAKSTSPEGTKRKAISSLPVPKLSEELNLYYEDLYLKSQLINKSKKQKNYSGVKSQNTTAGGDDSDIAATNNSEPTKTLEQSPSKTLTSKPNDESSKTTVEKNERSKLPKRKVALLLSYCGTNYNGMQITPTVPSIELDLFKALSASGAISKDNAMNPTKVSFVRCARTDKGMFALFLVVACFWFTLNFYV